MKPEFSIEQLGRWLDLTGQQAQVLALIYQLEEDSEQGSPKNIGRRYQKAHGKRIQKPNLFALLKILADHGLITKEGPADYRISFDGIQEALSQHRTRMEKETREFSQLEKSAQDYFRRHIARPDRPVVNYLDYNQLFTEFPQKALNVAALYMVSSFPLISYTYKLADSLGRTVLQETLWRRCLSDGSLRVHYLTDLDIDYLFTHSFRVHGDPKNAYIECEAILDQLETQVHSNKDSLDVRYVDELHGMDVAVLEPEDGTPKEFLLLIKDEHQDLSGGIHIKSVDTTRQAMDSFQRSFEYAEPLSGKQGGKILEGVRQRLQVKYGILQG